LQLETDVPLASRTTLGLGGQARFFVNARSEADVAEACEWARAQRRKLWVLGGGSNVVIPDAGLDGLVLALSLSGISLEARGDATRLIAASGEEWDRVVLTSVESGLSGIECLSGIPGLTGATPIQNVGAYGQEVAETLESVRAYDREGATFVEISRDSCEFAYRDSRFKARDSGRFVISEVRFLLSRAPRQKAHYPELARALAALGRTPTLGDTRESVLALRRAKSMLVEAGDPNARSCGSFFLNPVVSAERADAVERALAAEGMPRFPQPDGQVKLSAGWLIERSGFTKGTRQGNVGVSSKHALALVCHDGASSQELIDFSRRVQAAVVARTGVALTPEPQFF